MNGPGEGEVVAYAGEGDDGLAVDDRGKVLSAAGSGSHVMWSTGQRAGEITLTSNMDLIALRRPAVRDDSFESSGIVAFAVRDTYDRRGEAGLVNALIEEGHFATLVPVAEEALQLVSSRLREDPSMREVLGQLDPEEGAEFIYLAASVLLRDSFGAE